MDAAPPDLLDQPTLELGVATHSKMSAGARYLARGQFQEWTTDVVAPSEIRASSFTAADRLRISSLHSTLRHLSFRSVVFVFLRYQILVLLPHPLLLPLPEQAVVVIVMVFGSWFLLLFLWNRS